MYSDEADLLAHETTDSMNDTALSTPDLIANPADLKRALIEFARAASTEISTLDEERLAVLAPKLLPGMAVYVAHTPKASLNDVVRVALKVQSLGFRASPHIVARRAQSEGSLRAGLKMLREGGVEQVLLVAGDLDKPAGPFTSTLDLIDSGALVDAGIKRIGVAGHPEGHRAVDDAGLLAALRYKQAFGERTGISVHIATQFGFDPEAICAWDRRLSAQGIKLPVHVGIAGPTPLPKLIKFAVACGVGASLGAFMRNMGAMTKLAGMATTPDEMFVGLLRGRAAYAGSRIVQPHLYAFGGTVSTAEWLKGVAEGAFDLPAEGGKFAMRA
jgi:methylenetetrahydrofolate reductase (NADPH)